MMPICKKLILLSLFFSVAGSAAALDIIKGFTLTQFSYSELDNWDAAVLAEFGPAASLASFEEIKAAFEDEIPLLEQLLDGKSLGVSYQGNQYFSDTRGYFIVYHGASVPGGFLVHDKIGNTSTSNQVSLGSWYFDRQLIVAIPEPSTVVLALLLGLAVCIGLRRR